MPRTVTLILLDADSGDGPGDGPGNAAGAPVPLGALPPYDVPAPWWQEVDDVVAGARTVHGVEVSVLRLLAAERPAPHGGAVTYLAQLDRPWSAGTGRPAPAPLDAYTLDLVRAPHPLRAAWAEPGGPARSVRWAAGELARLGHGPVTASQRRAWNLSAIWRLDPASGSGPVDDPESVDDPGPVDRPGPVGAPVWLKQVPPFFRHEAAVLRWLGRTVPGLAPVLLADDGTGRMLLAHVPGEDGYGATLAVREAVAADHHLIQLAAVPEVDALVRAGVPDRRGTGLAGLVRDLLTRHGADLTGVAPLLDGLPGRLAEVAACGLPDTLVHGDLHPGNVRCAGDRRVLIDWGDSFVGHPAFDILRLTEGVGPADEAVLLAAWAGRWRASRPGCDPERAVRLLRPVAALRAAMIYADFLARIEPSEWPFHAADVAHQLGRAAESAAGR